MSILVLAVEKPYWQDVLIRLTNAGINIKASVVHYRYKSSPKKFFGDYKGIQIDGKKFYRVQDVRQLVKDEFGGQFEPLDNDIISALNDIERDFYVLTDRFCYFPLSFRDRKLLFRECIRFWLSFFRKYQIEAIFCSCTPHNHADYTAYHVAKYLGIPTVQLAHTMINDYVIVRHDYRVGKKVPAEFMLGSSEQEIISSISPELYKHAMNDSNVLNFVISKNDQAQGIKNLNVTASPKQENLWMKKLARRVKRTAYFAFTPPIFKGALAMNGLFPPSFRRILRVKNRIWQKQQWAYHNKLAVTPNLADKYIYFAMHMQPERTSTPEAEVFEDQLIAIEILARSLPSGWKLFVKENPRQFGKINILKSRHARNKSDYDDILRLPNTYLIKQDIPTKDLIANAQVVSTLSGSIGWESLKAGKPCIVFANAWYVECNSVYRVFNVNDAKLAIDNALIKTPEDVKLDMLKYLAYMQDNYSIGCMGDKTYLETSSVPYEYLVGKMAERLEKELKTST